MGKERHQYEVVPIINGRHGVFIIVGEYVRPDTGESKSISLAHGLMDEREDVEQVNVYRNRRYAGFVRRDGSELVRPK